MKIKAIAAAGAIGLGMGFAGLITAGSASADQCGQTDDPAAGPIGTGKIICNIQANGSFFRDVRQPCVQRSSSPLRHVGVMAGLLTAALVSWTSP